MKKLWATVVLWWYGYCTKHHCPKEFQDTIFGGFMACTECLQERLTKKCREGYTADMKRNERCAKARERLGWE